MLVEGACGASIGYRMEVNSSHESCESWKRISVNPRFISAERAGLATVKELYIEEPFSHTMLSKRRSSNEFKCRLNSLGRDSSCLIKLCMTLLRLKAVMPILSKTARNNIVTVLCVARTSSAEQASIHLWNKDVKFFACNTWASAVHIVSNTL